MEDFPLEILGLTPESIEMSKGHIMIPRELLPYIKICKMPVNLREKNTEKLQQYRLRLKHQESKKYLDSKKHQKGAV